MAHELTLAYSVPPLMARASWVNWPSWAVPLEKCVRRGLQSGRITYTVFPHGWSWHGEHRSWDDCPENRERRPGSNAGSARDNCLHSLAHLRMILYHAQ